MLTAFYLQKQTVLCPSSIKIKEKWVSHWAGTAQNSWEGQQTNSSEILWDGLRFRVSAKQTRRSVLAWCWCKFSVSPFCFCHAFEKRLVQLSLCFATTLKECSLGYPDIATYTTNPQNDQTKQVSGWFGGKTNPANQKVAVNHETISAITGNVTFYYAVRKCVPVVYGRSKKLHGCDSFVSPNPSSLPVTCELPLSVTVACSPYRLESPFAPNTRLCVALDDVVCCPLAFLSSPLTNASAYYQRDDTDTDTTAPLPSIHKVERERSSARTVHCACWVRRLKFLLKV